MFNPPRALKPISEMPPKAYHLADFDAYERAAAGAGRCTRPASPARTIAPTAPTPASTGASGTRSSRTGVEETTDLATRYG